MNPQHIIRFLTELAAHNHKTWFDANRGWYQEVKAEFSEFTEQLIQRVAAFDPRCQGLTVRDCTYRINRDIRFSTDKSPYKTHMGAYVCPQGKKSGMAGYYFHLQAPDVDYLNGNLLAVGAYNPSKEELQSMREEIFENAEGFKADLAQAAPFTLEGGLNDKLKKNPQGFPADFADMELLKYKSYCLAFELTDRQLAQEPLDAWVAGQFRRAYAFNERLNRAIQFAHEEML
ncbi:MAG: DUF2461 domain-containing protein [Paludibacteraceae bacterium]|nr:DUF2461 domain-containing protein [Paludibacteraceae bacterium]